VNALLDEVRAGLRARGRDWPAPLEHHPSLPSTSDRLKELARAGAPEWSAVMADEQTGGRGRHGRAWASPPGGLYLSVLLRPDFDAVGLIPLAAGVAVVDVLRGLGAVADLKWPNDVLASGRKLAGILAEASSSAASLDWVVLGVGVNLATPPEALVEFRESATSVQALTGAVPGPGEVAPTVLAALAAWYDALRRNPADVRDAWRERAAPWWGRRVELRSGGRTVTGVAEDIDADGALVLVLDDGGRIAVRSGEVAVVRLEAGGTEEPRAR
jgi:BirA family transcriptional regulator, biotin operon repressor / biotin---[acetyl-CoA-carboxylase] ligase